MAKSAIAVRLERGTNFLQVWIVILVLLFLAYVSIHALSNQPGSIHKKLPVTDLTVLNSFSDSTPFASQAALYLKTKYSLPAASEKSLDTILHSYTKKNALSILSNVGIDCNSYFWLDDNRVLMEMIFWGLFGTVCSFLYYFVENYKKDTLDEREFPGYFAKLFYTPFIIIIVYFSPALFSPEMAETRNNDYLTLVIAFILGFFSGRAIELLDRLKNLIFPYNSPDGSTPPTTPPVEGIPEAVFVEAVKEKAGEWSDLYGPIQAISVAPKITGGNDTGQFSIQFHVPEKRTDANPDKNIPPTLPFVWQGQVWQLPTDVVATEGARANSCYEKTDDKMFTGSFITPKFLGFSCSRAQSTAAGTIGFKAISRDAADTRSYMISCFHVFCNNELSSNPENLVVTDNGNSMPIISPETGLPGRIDMGYVRKGDMNNTMDASYAELTNPLLLNNVVYGTSFAPKIIVVLTAAHVQQQYQVMLAGRTSCKQVGYVLSHYTNVTVTYYRQETLIRTQQFEGIIKTCKISVPGDSGAPVIDLSGNAIGILFASDDEYSYIIPLLRIFNFYQLSFP
jgi:hypothetical protein